MDNGWLVLLVLIAGLLLAVPAVRRWWTSDEERPLVDPEQTITIEPVNSGTHWLHYQMSYRPRRAARGRRHQAPTSPSPDRVRRDPPSS